MKSITLKMKRLALAVSLFSFGLSAAVQAEEDASTGDDSFDYYYGEFINSQTADDDKILGLIEDGLCEALFDARDSADFAKRLQILRDGLAQKPALVGRYQALNTRVEKQAKLRMQAARTKKIWYAAGGAVIGLAIAIPAGKYLLGGPANKMFWIALPAGAALGTGAGFLLDWMIANPSFDYDSADLLSKKTPAEFRLMEEELKNSAH